MQTATDKQSKIADVPDNRKDMDDDENTVTKLIRNYVRTFSVAVFAVSALVLVVFVFPQERDYAAYTNKELGWKIFEEILKGLLAASAVAFLYDWVLKAATQRETRDYIRKEVGFLNGLDEKFAAAERALNNLCGDLRAIKFKSDGDDMEAQTAYLKEFILRPLPADFSSVNPNLYYHLCVHARFRACYFGEKVSFVLTRVGNIPKNPPDDWIFYWQISTWPSKTLETNWLQVTNLRVGGETWTESFRRVMGETIVVEFHRPETSELPPAGVITYEYDVKIIDNYVTPADLTLYIDYKLVRPTIRVDARALSRTDVVPILNPQMDALISKYFNAPEGDGTCEVFVEGEVAPGASVKFAILGN